MKEIFLGLLTYEIAQGLDKELSRRLGGDFSSIEEQQRLVAILFALEDLGLLSSRKRGRENSFFFDPKENLANDLLLITLKKSEWVHSFELSKRIGPTLKQA